MPSARPEADPAQHRARIAAPGAEIVPAGRSSHPWTTNEIGRAPVIKRETAAIKSIFACG